MLSRVPLKEATSWMVIGIIPFLIPCLSNQQEKRERGRDRECSRFAIGNSGSIVRTKVNAVQRGLGDPFGKLNAPLGRCGSFLHSPRGPSFPRWFYLPGHFGVAFQVLVSGRTRADM